MAKYDVVRGGGQEYEKDIVVCDLCKTPRPAKNMSLRAKSAKYNKATKVIEVSAEKVEACIDSEWCDKERKRKRIR